MSLNKCIVRFNLPLLLCLTGCVTGYHENAEVLCEYSSSMHELFLPNSSMPVAACGDDFIVASAGVIYKIRGVDFAHPNVLCDARPPGFEVTVRNHGVGVLDSVVGDLTVSPSGKIYYCDGKVNEVLSDGSHRVLAGSDETGFCDSPLGTEARFYSANALCWRKGKIVVSDSLNNALREVDPETSEVRTLFGTYSNRHPCLKGEMCDASTQRGRDGKFDVATLCNPMFVLCDDEGRLVVISNSDYVLSDECSVRRVDISTMDVVTLARTLDGDEGLVDGPMGVSRIGRTTSATIDDEGNTYLVNGRFIRKIDKNGVVATIYCNETAGGEADVPLQAIVFCRRLNSLIIFDGASVKSLKLTNS